MKACSKKQYCENLQSLATEAFAKHEIREMRDEGHRYALWKRHPKGAWDSNMATEIIVIRGGLFVGGDSPDCIFRWFSDSQEPRDVIRWMGGHPTADSYVAGKARIGLGHEFTELVDAEVALYDIEYHLEHYEQDHDEPMKDSRRWEVERAIASLKSSESAESVIREMYENGIDSEWLAIIGRVPAARVFYAHAAVRKLWTLMAAVATSAPDVASVGGPTHG
jgi:hypothetical protein